MRLREIPRIQGDALFTRAWDGLRAILNPILRSLISSVSGTAPISVAGMTDLVVSHDASGATPGTYANATVQVDAKGHVVAASSGASPVGSVSVVAPIANTGTATAPVITTSMATDRLLGRDTAGTGVAEEIGVGGGVEFSGAGAIQRSALSGDVTATAGSVSVTVDQARGLRETAGPTTLTMGAVTDGEFLKRSGSTIVSAAAGLTNWTEAVSTAAPNATVPAVSLTATNAAANVDAVIAAKGTGGILAAVPDSTATGGNKRGAYAVDLQRDRGNAAYVASGDNSVVVGGQYNRATATMAFAGGGYNNNASGIRSVIVGGEQQTASGLESAICGGEQNQATAGQSFVGGGSLNRASGGYAGVVAGSNNTASGSNSFIGGGDTNVASGTAAGILCGYSATTRGLAGRISQATGAFSVVGDAQWGTLIVRRQTTDATLTQLTAEGGAPGTTVVNVLPNNHSYSVRVDVVARQSAGAAGTVGDTKVWRLDVAIKRGANAAATALVGALTSVVIGADAGAAAWTAVLVANTTRGSVEVEVTGEASKTIRWVATMYTVEVG